MNQSSSSSATAAEVLAVDVVDGRVAPDDADCEVEFARRGREADLVVATLEADARAHVRNALLVVGGHDDIEAHDGAAFVDGESLFGRALAEAERAHAPRRVRDGRYLQPLRSRAPDARRACELAERAGRV